MSLFRKWGMFLIKNQQIRRQKLCPAYYVSSSILLVWGGAAGVPWSVHAGRDWGETSLQLQLLREGKRRGRHWALLCGDSRGLEETMWSWVKGGFCWILGKGSSPTGCWALERLPREAVTAIRLTELKKYLDRALRHMAWLLECPLRGQESDSMLLMDLFQLSTFYDSMKNWMVDDL